MHRIFMVLLILPAALWAASPDRGALLLENRSRAEMPTLPADLHGVPNYLQKLDAAVADNIGLRDQLIAAKNWLDRKINRYSNSRVIAGKDGWLFFNGAGVVERNAGLDFQPERVENMVRFVNEAQELAKAQGARFVALPVPNSHSLYRDYLPDWAQPQGSPPTEQRAIAERLKAEGIATSDPYLIFRDMDLAGKPLYFRRDTHWNGYGAYIAFHDAMGLLGLAKEIPAPNDVLRGYVNGKYYGVLDQFIGLSEPAESEALPDLDLTNFARFPELTVKETDDHVAMDSYEVSYAADRPRLLVIGDSFSYGFFRQYWGAAFSDVHWSHHNYGRYDRTVFERFKPDYVIFEFVDWEIPAWVAFEARFAAQ